ncbi:cbb3-type cytochrome c oxidase subunit II [Vibrio sp. TBV020]|uniref:cbb3-type cytochrome c oxidase subunit II n=1 Tax=Vibrio sp. TBV020 TaxID=3137398 RepID=UPI0038CD72D1
MENSISKSLFAFITITTIVVMFSFFVWVFPSFFYTNELAKKTIAQPYTALELAGRDVYMAQGCVSCHTQMVRNIEAERKRYGRPNEMEDDVYEFTFLWSSQRTGPDLTNIGLKYTPDWHKQHLINPQSVVPNSIMPQYPWLFEKPLDPDHVVAAMETMKKLGVPYSDNQIAKATNEVKDKTEGDALVSYLMSLGVDTHNDVGGLQ